jgi:hypothetical protein
MSGPLSKRAGPAADFQPSSPSNPPRPATSRRSCQTGSLICDLQGAASHTEVTGRFTLFKRGRGPSSFFGSAIAFAPLEAEVQNLRGDILSSDSRLFGKMTRMGVSSRCRIFKGFEVFM